MKYTYAYKTPDGVRHEAAMDAPSREEVFATLRRQGIRAIKVVAADGSKANGEVRGIRRRAVAALVALAVLVVGVAVYLGGTRSAATVTAAPTAMSPRHQIYGDPAVMESLERGDFGGILTSEGDRMLATFAQPGRLMCAGGANPAVLVGDAEAAFADFARHGLAAGNDLRIDDGDSREVRELKQIVNGMREEMRTYLANGNGTVRSYWRRLNERTLEERRIRDRIRRELENERSPEVRERRNETLRRLGLRTIPRPAER